MSSRLFERFTKTARATGLVLADAEARDLERRLVEAERMTPNVERDPEDFCASLVKQLANAPDVAPDAAQLHIEDLYFAWALANGEKAAFQRFEREFLPALASQVAPHQRDIRTELEQLVRTRLLVPSDGRPARITQYSGRGPFGAWLRMVGKRTALDILRSRGRGHERELDSPTVPTDPELDYLKLRYASDFKGALEQALLGLDARQVTLLKLSFIEQIPATAVGVMYGVSARTVQRWLAEIRDTVLLRTREGLKARLSLSPSELDSLLGLMQSQLHVTLHRVLEVAQRKAK